MRASNRNRNNPNNENNNIGVRCAFYLIIQNAEVQYI
ncbi:MAG: hypothetical protein MUE54_01225 [Anaerolineae bacterium]|nr:hypothetical protein [Anaerolineae bacterium]